MKKENRNKLLLMLTAIVLVMLSCSEVFVINESAMKVRVIVSMPGESVPETSMLISNDSDTFFSDYEGRYTVSVTPDEDYRVQMLTAQDSMRTLLFTGFDQLSQTQISSYIKQIDTIDKLLENISTISCSGEALDNVRTDVIISTDPETQKLSVICDQ